METETKTPETPKPETAETPKPRRNRKPKTETAPAQFDSITAGDRAYIGAELTKKLFTQYPFIETFLTNHNYHNAREHTVYIAHNIKNPETGKTRRITAFIKTAGKNKIRDFKKPETLKFTPETAVKKYPELKPLAGFDSPVLFITIEYGAKRFRLHISFTN